MRVFDFFKKLFGKKRKKTDREILNSLPLFFHTNDPKELEQLIDFVRKS